jgi:hypothetical protein
VGDGKLLKLGVDVARSTVAKYMVRGCRHRARTGRPSSATTPESPRWICSLCRQSVSGSSMRSRSWTMIAGLSSQWRSHPIPRPNGLRGRSPKPFPGKRHRNTCSATATPSMGASSGNGSPQRVSAIGPSRPVAMAKRIYRTPHRLSTKTRQSIAPPITPGRSWQFQCSADSTTTTFGPSFGRHTPCRCPHRKE